MLIAVVIDLSGPECAIATTRLHRAIEIIHRTCASIPVRSKGRHGLGGWAFITHASPRQVNHVVLHRLKKAGDDLDHAFTARCDTCLVHSWMHRVLIAVP